MRHLLPTFALRCLVVGAVAGLPAAAGAQAAALKPLALPEGAPLRCAVATSDARPLPAGSVRLQYEIGRPGNAERSITLVIDSAGRAAQLTEIAVEAQGAGAEVLHGITASFDSAGNAEGFHTRRDQGTAAPSAASDSAARRASQDRVLPLITTEDAVRLRALASWLVQRRCDRPAPKDD